MGSIIFHNFVIDKKIFVKKSFPYWIILLEFQQSKLTING